MWFYDDKDDNDGFPGLIGRARLMGWLCLFGFVGFVAWVLLK
jgi:hypothetical protein